MSLDYADIAVWLGSFVWPWLRVSAMLVAAPIFGNMQIPVRIRVLFGLVLGVAVMPVVGPVPAVDLISVEAMLVGAQEVLVGITIGFLLAMAFHAAVIAGEAIAMGMGLGFASMADPQTGFMVPVLSQFMQILATLLFLSIGGHLMLIELLGESFALLPVGQGLGAEALRGVVAFGSQMFAGGVLIALPAVAALLMVNLAMGVMTRAAPQMNIFSVGFPVTMLAGFLIVMTLTLPSLQPRLVDIWSAAFGVTRNLLGGGG